MREKSIKIQRTESILKELIPEALNTLSDEILRSLTVLDVDCSKGKYDAKVFLDESMYDKDEKEYILSHLKKAKGIIESYCLQAEGWYRCPSLRFEFDNTLQKQQKLEMLFDKISKELHHD